MCVTGEDQLAEAPPAAARRLGLDPRSWQRVALALAALCLLAARLRTHSEPVDRDIAVYSVAAGECLRGKALYTDVWDHKPPAVHCAFAVGQILTGSELGAILLLNVAFSLLCMLGVYQLVARQLRSRWLGVWAAALWVVLSGDLTMEGNQPNVELFLNAFLVWGWCLLLRLEGRRTELPQTVLVGVLFAVASMFKQIAVIYAALLALCHVLTVADEGRARRTGLLQLVVIGVVGLVLWLGVFAYFGALGRLGDFWKAAFVYNRHYGGDVLRNVFWEGLKPWNLASMARLGNTVACAAVFLAGLLATDWRRRPRLAFSLITYAACTHAAVAAPGKFWAHYYQLWLPLLVVGAAYGVARIGELARDGCRRRVVVSLACGVLVSSLALEVQFLRWDAEQTSMFKFGPKFLQSRELALEVDQLLEPGETVFVWGAYPDFFLYSGRSPSTCVFYHYPLLSGPLAGKLTERVLRELEANPPEIFVLDTGDVGGKHRVLDFFRGTYRLLKKPESRLHLYCRVGGALEKRLAQAKSQGQAAPEPAGEAERLPERADGGSE